MNTYTHTHSHWLLRKTKAAEVRTKKEAVNLLLYSTNLSEHTDNSIEICNSLRNGKCATIKQHPLFCFKYICSIAFEPLFCVHGALLRLIFTKSLDTHTHTQTRKSFTWYNQLFVENIMLYIDSYNIRHESYKHFYLTGGISISTHLYWNIGNL